MRMTKEQRRVAAQPLSYEHNSETIPDVRNRLPDHLPRRGEILFPNGRMLVQRPLPPRVGHVGFNSYTTVNIDPATPADNQDRLPDGGTIFDIERTPPISPSKHRKKRAAQWRRWDQEIIPLLIPHYSWVVWETKFLRELEKLGPPVQDCDCIPRNQRVTIMRFSSVEDMDVPVCDCRLAAVTLVRGGAFPCAPLQPSLAVDLRVLEFASKLFLNIAPNHTAFSTTLETILSTMGYQLNHQNTLRRRFGNALTWYGHLRNRSKAHYRAALEKMRPAPSTPVVARDESPDSSPHRGASPARPSTPETPCPDRSPSRSPSPARHVWGQPREPTPGLSPTTPSRSERGPPAPPRLRKRGRSPRPDRPDPPFPDPLPRSCPSEYLRRRCPLCFGNLYRDPSQLVDLIVCLDACFTQKRRTSASDPPRRHPCTHFVPEADAKATDAYVNETRGSFGPAEPQSKKSKTKTPSPAEETEDGYEHPDLLLPRSVFDACEASFKAADEKRAKASTDFFDDTGLMALLCRHDRVLWLVNMQTRGEQQYYVIVLLETLFQHLPRDITVGILYDIACTLELFHAFGHDWPCQLLYHPRKRNGFGLSDGEGCERFWHSISHLIAVLRISGKWQRLYVLDAQIEHADELSLQRLGDWLRRRSLHSRKKRQEAESVLAQCRVRISALREQWQLQVVAQTKPLPRRSKNKGQQAINAILLLRSAVKKQTDHVNHLRAKFLGAAEDADEEADYYQVEFDKADAARAKAEKTLREKERALGVGEHQALSKMSHIQYYSARMNARAMKRRLRDRLRQRKFELDLVERSFRRLVNEQKLYSHTEAAVKRREKGIQNLALEYNKQCAKIAQLVRDKNAPRGALAPRQIPDGQLWKLDVDDEIWEDVGLDDNETEQQTAPPPWLCDDDVRAGIKALLQIDRCREEDVRLKKERAAMQVWFAEEWVLVNRSLNEADTAPDRYQYELMRDDLKNFLTRRKNTRAGGENEVFRMLDTLATADAYREEDVESVDEQDDLCI
ncbi:hypothetical protein C8R44DRAFT_894812 [Mycena epipterygia]|nr:hypothetical protein C8R44DRAFT_895440 [Mycena epipterygia]KAJ7082514.1 hypothetical protein C8R44DRAFT_894812 [Mycena epipterygia]